MRHPALAAPGGTCRRTFREGEEIHLTFTARWPRPEGEGRGADRIRRYYDALADRWIRRWSGPLLDRAKGAAAQGDPPWSAELDYATTYEDDRYVSYRLDVTESWGGRRRQVRLGDVWALPQGAPVHPRELLPKAHRWRSQVLSQVREQIGGRIGSGESVYYDGWESLCARWLSPDRFLLTPEGPVVFYPMETIAPAMEGFPTFLLEGRAPDGAGPAPSPTEN